MTKLHAQSTQEVYNEIVQRVNTQGHPYKDWYAGIASDWADSLIVQHKAKFTNYIARQCLDCGSAKKVEEALLKAGFDGGSGDGDNSSVYVYAYLKTPNTVQ